MFLLSNFEPSASSEVDLRLHRARPVSLGLVSKRASLPQLKRDKPIQHVEPVEEVDELQKEAIETEENTDKMPMPVHLGRADSQIGRLMSHVSNPLTMSRIGYICGLVVVLFVVIMLFHLSSRVSELQRTVTMLMLIRR